MSLDRWSNHGFLQKDGLTLSVSREMVQLDRWFNPGCLHRDDPSLGVSIESIQPWVPLERWSKREMVKPWVSPDRCSNPELGIQHHSTLQARHQAPDPGSRPRPVQLGTGLPDGPLPGGEGRQQHLPNNLTLNKTKQMIVDFRKQQRQHPPIHIDGTVLEKVESLSSSVYISLRN